MKTITRTVWVLSLVSLLTDTASEMLYPIMPIYLRSIGFSIVLIGILEGTAEATAGLSKGYFGKLSDHTGKRMPFVQWGYGLSALSKPLMVFFITPVWVFFARTIDRLGKGLRTGARDAVLSDEATPATKGEVFGFHRSMDTLGAVIGPLLALLYLQRHPQDYKTLFILAFVPGILAVCCSFLLKDKTGKARERLEKVAFFSFLHYWKFSPALYKRLVIGLLLFTLFNSSDVFLLLKVKQAGLNDGKVIAVYIFYNVVYSVFAFPVGIYAAATEGISKAWISNIIDKKDTATAIGTYSGFQSICTMIASSLAGLIWFQFGAKATFLVAGFAVVLILLYVSFIPFKRYKHKVTSAVARREI